MSRRRVISLVLAVLVIGISYFVFTHWDDEGWPLETRRVRDEPRSPSGEEGEHARASKDDSRSPTPSVSADRDPAAASTPVDSDRMIRVLVVDSENRPVEGRRVKLGELDFYSKFVVQEVVTGSDGMARFEDVDGQIRADIESKRIFVAMLLECPAPLSMTRVKDADVDAEPLRLQLPDLGRLEIRLAGGMFASRLANLHAAVEDDESVPRERPPVLSDLPESWAREFDRSEFVVADPISVDTPAVWTNVSVNRRFKVGLERNGRVLAERVGVAGPTFSGESVVITIGPDDVLDTWFGIEVKDPLGVPVAESTFELVEQGRSESDQVLETDAAGRGVVLSSRWDAANSPNGQSEGRLSNTDGSVRPANWTIEARRQGIRSAEFQEPVGRGAFVSVTLEEQKEDLVLSGKILRSDGTAWSRAWMRAKADDGKKGMPPAPTACLCGLTTGRDVRADRDGGFEIRSSCGHRRIVVHSEMLEDRFRVVFTDLPRHDVTIRARKATPVNGEIRVDPQFRATDSSLEIVVSVREGSGQPKERTTARIKNELGRWTWFVRLGEALPTTLEVRLKTTGEVLASLPEFTPGDESVSMPPFELEGRLRHVTFDVTTADGSVVEDISARVEGMAASTSLEGEPVQRGRFKLLCGPSTPRVSIGCDGWKPVTVDLVEGMNIMLSSRIEERK